jgi:hypothetical protein
LLGLLILPDGGDVFRGFQECLMANPLGLWVVAVQDVVVLRVWLFAERAESEGDLVCVGFGESGVETPLYLLVHCESNYPA